MPSLDISESSKYFKAMSFINELRNLKLYDYPNYEYWAAEFVKKYTKLNYSRF